MTSVIQDLRHSLAAVIARPAHTAVIVLTTALGIGANTVILSYVDATWLRPVPVPDSSRLLHVNTTARSASGIEINGESSYADYLDIRHQSQFLQDVIAYEHRGALLHLPGEVVHLAADTVSPNYFIALGVTAEIGRTFTENDFAQAYFPVVISHELWQQQFGADRGIIGKDIRLSNGTVTIVGVMPRRFYGVDLGTRVQVWIPAPTWTHITGDSASFTRRGSRRQDILARIAKGSSLPAVRAELQTIQGRLKQTYPDADKDLSLRVESEREARDASSKHQGWMLLAIAAMVLLIACANVVNLQLTRTESRRKEFATRRALGGSTRRLVQQLMAESVVQVALGLAIGLAIARAIIDAMSRLIVNSASASAFDFRLDTRVVSASCAVALLIAAVFGLVAGWRASRVRIIEALKGTEIVVSRDFGLVLRDLLVAAQVALSLVLLVAAGLLIRTFFNIEGVDPGFNVRKPMLLVQLVPGLADYEGAKLASYYRAVAEQMNTLPGVERAALAVRAPLSENSGGAQLEMLPPGAAAPAGQKGYAANFTWVGPEYFSVMGTRLLAGRAFSDEDGPSSERVAIVNRTLANQLWGTGQAVGQRVNALSMFGQSLAHPRQFRVVGVVEDSKWKSITEKPRPIIYLSLWQGADSEATLLVRTRGNPVEMIGTIRRELFQLDSNVPMLSATTLAEQIDQTTSSERDRVLISSALSAVGLLLSAAGIYGVLSFFVTLRTREIGLRMAVGGSRPHIMAWVLRRGMRLLGLGTAIGLGISMLLTRLLVSLLYGIPHFDAVSMLGGTALMACIGLAAIYFPARRASKLQPMDALRTL
ncbi:MAG: ABC transporter permease [Terracidiphilus sp.]